MKLLAISGSLRAASINSALCRAAARLAPPPLRVTVFAGLGKLPLFNPDLEIDLPPQVQTFRGAVDDANALLIASPEYAHGISGSMKNALDWLVSFEGAVHKPIALFNASPRAHHANESLREILRTMSTNIVEEASATIPLAGSYATEEAVIASPCVSTMIRVALDALVIHLAGRSARSPNFPLS